MQLASTPTVKREWRTRLESLCSAIRMQIISRLLFARTTDQFKRRSSRNDSNRALQMQTCSACCEVRRQTVAASRAEKTRVSYCSIVAAITHHMYTKQMRFRYNLQNIMCMQWHCRLQYSKPSPYYCLASPDLHCAADTKLLVASSNTTTASDTNDTKTPFILSIRQSSSLMALSRKQRFLYNPPLLNYLARRTWIMWCGQRHARSATFAEGKNFYHVSTANFGPLYIAFKVVCNGEISWIFLIRKI